MTLFKQVLTIFNKNMTVSIRNNDLIMEIGVPMIIALILSLKSINCISYYRIIGTTWFLNAITL